MKTILIIIALMIADFITGIIYSAIKTRKKFFCLIFTNILMKILRLALLKKRNI